MKFVYQLIISSSLFFLCSCAMFYTKQPASAPVASTPRPLVIPVGKKWQVIEAPPKLRSGQGRLPFQTEQSLQPVGAPPLPPADNRTIETSH